MSGGTAAGGRTVDRAAVGPWLRDHGVYVAFVLLLVFNLIFTENFASFGTFSNLLVQVSPVLLVSLGLALVIGTEGIDLSVGAIMALASAALPLYLGYGWPLAIGLSLFVGIAAGLLNGSLVAFAGVQPIVATLALLVAGRGLAQIFTSGQLLIITDPVVLALGQARPFGIPAPVIVAAVAVALVAFLIRRTTFGRYVVAIGGNRSASYLSGHPVRRTLLAVYAISGLLAAVAGIVAAARLGASDPSNVGVLIELSAITAVVVGGTPLTGGRVRLAGTVMGALLMQLISTTFISNNLPFTYAQVLTAGIILIAVYVQKGRGAA
jgi:ribose/xylose/arabinose/galactoside ABC-type transport system permease subunit